MGFCINSSLVENYFAVGKSFDGLCSEVEIRVNVWTVRRVKRTGRCRLYLTIKSFTIMRTLPHEPVLHFFVFVIRQDGHSLFGKGARAPLPNVEFRHLHM